MSQSEKNGVFPLLLYLPFKGKGAQSYQDQLLEALAESESALHEIQEWMNDIATGYRFKCKDFPLRIVLQNTPRGNYLRWRTVAKNGAKQRYLSNETVMASKLPKAAKGILLEYCKAITQANAAASILNHNKRVLKGQGKTMEDLSCHILDSDDQI